MKQFFLIEHCDLLSFILKEDLQHLPFLVRFKSLKGLHAIRETIAIRHERLEVELAGFKNIRTKSLGSNNKQNVVLATINGLSQLKTPEQVAALRGLAVDEL